MLRLLRTVCYRTDKSAEATQWAKAIADYLNKTYPGHGFEAHTELFGDWSTVHWTSTYASLADWEAVNAKRGADAAYATLIQKGQDLVIEGSGHDTLLRSI
jgi:hypothetical protein